MKISRISSASQTHGCNVEVCCHSVVQTSIVILIPLYGSCFCFIREKCGSVNQDYCNKLPSCCICSYWKILSLINVLCIFFSGYLYIYISSLLIILSVYWILSIRYRFIVLCNYFNIQSTLYCHRIKLLHISFIGLIYFFRYSMK